MKRDGLTELEIRVLEASRKSDFGDCFIEPSWSFSVCDASGLNEKVYRGVVSSLVKKGLVVIQDDEGKGRFRDMVFILTENGKKLWE